MSTVPQPQAPSSPPLPTSAIPTSPLASSVAATFPPQPRPGNMIQELEFVGAKHSPWTDEKTGMQKHSVKVFIMLGADHESEFSEFVGRVPSAFDSTMEVFQKLRQNRVDPRDATISLCFETRMVATKTGQKITIVDFHLPPKTN
jgi:hypothetical protein